MTTRILAFAVVALMVVPALAWSNEIATVNGKTLTSKDMEEALNTLNEGQRNSLLKDYNSKRQLLNTLIDRELLDQQAGKEKLDQDAEFKTALDLFKKQFLANRVLRKNLTSKLSDSAAKKFYDTNKTRYSTEEVHAQHILVDDEAKANEIAEMAKKSGADFQALAEKYSKDPSVKNNRGDLGFFGRGQMVPEFTDAAFAGKDGTIVGPVRTSYGYHVIKVVEHKAGKILEYSDVEGRVKSDLQAEVTQEYLNGLRKSSKISVDDKALKKM